MRRMILRRIWYGMDVIGVDRAVTHRTSGEKHPGLLRIDLELDRKAALRRRRGTRSAATPADGELALPLRPDDRIDLWPLRSCRDWSRS